MPSLKNAHPGSAEAMTQNPVTRSEQHFRRIDMRGYARSDGLFEVEGRVTDRKSEPFTALLGGRDVPANQALHDMGVRLVFDRSMTIVDVETFTEAAPYSMCPAGGQSLQALKGLRMTSGWSKRIRDVLANPNTCTHLMHLLVPMATVAFQTLSPVRRDEGLARDADGRPLKIDSCYAYGAGQALVQQHWPEYYRPGKP